MATAIRADRVFMRVRSSSLNSWGASVCMVITPSRRPAGETTGIVR
jgi:hypothetical protein